jgi:hypothetical protein
MGTVRTSFPKDPPGDPGSGQIKAGRLFAYRRESEIWMQRNILKAGEKY